jgi:hypothetical protein
VTDKPIESRRGVELGSSLFCSSAFYCPIQNQLFDKVWCCVDDSVNGHLSAYIGFNLKTLVTDSIWDSVRTNVRRECEEYKYTK